jgi:hypothetical protein
MSYETLLQALALHRRVFPAWSIDVPPGWEETFLEDDQYWHAWTDDASISLTSIALADDRGPVPAALILEQLAPAFPKPWIEDLPEGLPGYARIAVTDPPARAGHFVQGLTATAGRALLATITSDDLDWARSIWRSLRAREAPLPARGSRAWRRRARGKRRGHRRKAA